jgi:hypothetical protein
MLCLAAAAHVKLVREDWRDVATAAAIAVGLRSGAAAVRIAIAIGPLVAVGIVNCGVNALLVAVGHGARERIQLRRDRPVSCIKVAGRKGAWQRLHLSLQAPYQADDVRCGVAIASVAALLSTGGGHGLPTLLLVSTGLGKHLRRTISCHHGTHPLPLERQQSGVHVLNRGPRHIILLLPPAGDPLRPQKAQCAVRPGPRTARLVKHGLVPLPEPLHFRISREVREVLEQGLGPSFIKPVAHLGRARLIATAWGAPFRDRGCACSITTPGRGDPTTVCRTTAARDHSPRPEAVFIVIMTITFTIATIRHISPPTRIGGLPLRRALPALTAPPLFDPSAVDIRPSPTPACPVCVRMTAAPLDDVERITPRLGAALEAAATRVGAAHPLLLAAVVRSKPVPGRGNACHSPVPGPGSAGPPVPGRLPQPLARVRGWTATRRQRA